MKDGFTRLALILDRSGSMATIEEATVAGVNKFIAEQKQVPGTATLKLVQFDDVYEEVFDTPIAEAPELTLSKTPRPGQKTYEPRGCTALLDAIGRTITELGSGLAAMPEDARPSKVIVVIMTDGLENASKVFTTHQVLDMVVLQRDTYKWDFVYLGANQDAIATAATMGIAAPSAMNYAANRTATTNAVHAMSAAVRRSRTTGQNVSYTSHERHRWSKMTTICSRIVAANWDDWSASHLEPRCGAYLPGEGDDILSFRFLSTASKNFWVISPPAQDSWDFCFWALRITLV